MPQGSDISTFKFKFTFPISDENVHPLNLLMDETYPHFMVSEIVLVNFDTPDLEDDPVFV